MDISKVLMNEMAEFQSLFSWNLLLMFKASLVDPTNKQFQSLFSWNLLLMGIE